jgi:butyrate kinase
MNPFRIFAINPGSTSTKIAYFENEKEIIGIDVSHDAGKLKEFKEISDQFSYRKDTILNEVKRNHIQMEGMDAFVGRGGGLVALVGGTYEINDILLHHARTGFTVKHPAILGSQLAYDFAACYGGKAFVVNPPDVDEFEAIARISGLACIARESRVHALNQKEIGIRYAKEIGKRYEDLNLVISHIGGGVSVTAHKKGRMIDSNDIVNGDGPMAPTRSGALPASALVKMCFSGNYSEKDMYGLITKNGGLVNHLETSDVREILARIQNGDRHAKLIYDAMGYQIAKNIGAYATVLSGKVDAIILTGGIANDETLVNQITGMVRYIAPVKVMPGEFEMEALAAGTLRVLRGEEKALEYTGIPVRDAD